ncbi:MAG: DUF1552 domain-containing protein [Myxococcaceae bacterium]|nr:DUF1552 domain-containing protein [Myxococcaceae bacterium]
MNPSRRDVLLGGTALLASARAFGQSARPKRFIAMYFPNGCFPQSWFPGGGETSFTLASSHASLEPYKQHCLFFAGLDLKVAVSGPGEQHQRGIGAFLTGQTLQTGTFVGNDGTTSGWANGASLDQLLIPLVGRGSVAPSLQLGVRCNERDVSGVISYSGAAAPLLAQNDPSQTFKTLFGQVPGPPDEMERRRRRRASVLDAVKKQFPISKRNLSKADAERLDRHLDEVRELETRVAGLPDNPNCPPPAAPPDVAFTSEASMGQVAKLQADLLVKAFECDLTRVATIAFSDAKNHIGMPFIGITSGVHNISHYGDSNPDRAELATRDRWVTEQLAYLVKKLKETPDGNGTLLDNTLLMLGSELGQGNTHSHDNVPLILAGHGAGFRMGRYLKYNRTSWNDMLLGIYKGFGGTGDTFGAAGFTTGALPHLT